MAVKKAKPNPTKVKRAKLAKVSSPPASQFVVVGIRKGGPFVDLHGAHDNAADALTEAWDVSNAGSTAIVCLGYASKGARTQGQDEEDVRRAASILAKSKGKRIRKRNKMKGFFPIPIPSELEKEVRKR